MVAVALVAGEQAAGRHRHAVVRDGVVCTPPSSAGALAGITQDTVLRLAGDLGLTVRRESLLRADLYAADEVFMSGTAAGVVPVRSVDDRELPATGRVSGKISAAFTAVVNGEDERYRHWLTPVRVEEPARLS
ncbi:branched-chain amino acid aminotransferase [Saccharopolyspora erythraea NRRL 2338]|uniref:Branched-chain amino acid aminotransferase n=1 Tax=Saccharopolyspora erythraea (strain ATCC 11635 / DSM 40517 / JCM 4748 / NBRC 13426 / NCIMB 8594 / NRRL 2338) TaxID=405948 RepID=A4FBK9_SACEN|nr:branched-chain amino acid aminotransferase [Saccharopolyspora erythraea NRRL 2338]